MVGYRNNAASGTVGIQEFIRHSDGGVSEQCRQRNRWYPGVYQAFRWWGIGTMTAPDHLIRLSLSGIPMVGYRNFG